jgi:hypothetical protein
VKVRREARVALAQAQRMYASDFAERDPGEVLLGTVADIDAVVQRLKRQVDGQDFLTAHDLVLLRDWLEMAAKWSNVVLSGRIEERQVKLAEQTAAQFVSVIQGVLADLGLDPRSSQVRHVVAERLKAIGGVH